MICVFVCDTSDEELRDVEFRALWLMGTHVNRLSPLYKKGATRNSPLTWGRAWRSTGTHSNITLTKISLPAYRPMADSLNFYPMFNP